MTRSALHIVPAAFAFLAAVFVTDTALAQCPSGTYQCGADYCTPNGAVCCANVGWPEYYCPSGSTCQSDGSCQSGSSSSASSSSSSSGTSGGGGGCPSGSYQCGADYCTPNGAVCCANVGWPEYYCPSGSTCQSDGSCQSGSSSNVSSSSSSGTTGGSDGCPSGSYACGADYCTPVGEVCCANVGLPQYYCPGGTVCYSDGSCGPGSTSNTPSSSSSSTTSSTGGCPSGSYACGADYCTPVGEVCCADVGLPQYYCPGGTVCQSDGSCVGFTTSSSSDSNSSDSNSSDSSSSDSSSNTSSSGPTTSTGGSGNTSTSTSSSVPEIDGCSSYYDHGYDEYQVEVQCQSAYIYACAGHQEGVTASCDILADWGYGSREACPYCTGTDPRESSSSSSSSNDSSSGGGCALSPSGSTTSDTALWLALLGFGGALRRRLTRRARRV